MDWNFFSLLALFWYVVALHVRAWIETPNVCKASVNSLVALHVRAWIETYLFFKLLIFSYVALHVRAWIETNNVHPQTKEKRCRPPCEGVDWNIKKLPRVSRKEPSPSMWGRGLKLLKRFVMSSHTKVALHVRAWIETQPPYRYIKRRWCRPPCEGVDWNGRKIKMKLGKERSPSMWGRGLKQERKYNSVTCIRVALHVRAWIETFEK